MPRSLTVRTASFFWRNIAHSHNVPRSECAVAGCRCRSCGPNAAHSCFLGRMYADAAPLRSGEDVTDLCSRIRRSCPHAHIYWKAAERTGMFNPVVVLSSKHSISIQRSRFLQTNLAPSLGAALRHGGLDTLLTTCSPELASTRPTAVLRPRTIAHTATMQHFSDRQLLQLPHSPAATAL